jgi:YVTN family beta-propeller protein
MKQSFMKYLNKYLVISTIAALALFAGCQKDVTDGNEGNVDPASQPSAYVLNEGSYGSNDSDLSLVNTSTGTINKTFFSSTNNRLLGNTAQDLIAYGSKLYVTVTFSNTVEVVNPKTGKSIKQIDFGQRNPRYMVAYNGKVYVSCYDKTVVRIDTATLSIEGSCPLSGMRPEGMCESGGKLYVCNSWEYTDNNSVIYDSTISVVDISTFQETKKITVSANPQRIKALANGKIAIICGNGYYNAAVTTVLDAATESLTDLQLEASNMDVVDNTLYVYHYNYSTHQYAFWQVDGNTLQKTPLLQNCRAGFVMPYGINVNPANGDIYITDAQNYTSNGDVYCFAPDGTLHWRAETVMGPSKVVFIP